MKGATVLITGGSGSLGSALVRRVLDAGAARVIVLSRGEHRQAALEREINDTRLECWLKDVTDRDDMRWAMRAHPDVVIHAAALKRIEKCEQNPDFARKVNVDGTRYVVEEAMLADVPKVLFVSSDKATEPITVYGKTKACAEAVAIGQNAYRGLGRTRVSVVRYGNVESSQGSVIPLFRAKAAAGEPLPITHLDMTRFSWPLSDAVRFVTSVIEQMRGAEIFIPKLQSRRIVDVARAIAPGASLDVIGMRGLEKLHEAMVSADEAPFAWELPDRYVILPATGQWWSPGPPVGAKAVPAGFRYSSEQAASIGA